MTHVCIKVEPVKADLKKLGITDLSHYDIENEDDLKLCRWRCVPICDLQVLLTRVPDVTDKPEAIIGGKDRYPISMDEFERLTKILTGEEFEG